MNKKITALFFSLSIFNANIVHGIEIQTLTGDTRLACEAILCLSSSFNPSECTPSISKLFSIKLSKPWKTLEARKNFLNLCPASSEPNMPQLIDDIVNVGELCSTDGLNEQTLKARRDYNFAYKQWGNWQIASDISNGYWVQDEDSGIVLSDGTYSGTYSHALDDDNFIQLPYMYEIKTVINNKIPSQCYGYHNSQLTYFDDLVYIGDIFNGGHWSTK